MSGDRFHRKGFGWPARLAIGLVMGLGAVAFPCFGAAPPAAPGCPLAIPPTLDAVECLSIGDRNVPLFAELSWRAFMFLTWPALLPSPATGAGPVRGVPGPPGQGGRSTPVFLTFKADWETFRKHAAPPLPWLSYPAVADTCDGFPPIDPGTLVLSSLHEFGNVREPGFSNITNVLPARNGQLVRYMTSFGPEEFGLIFDHELYNARRNTPPGPGAPSAAAAALTRAIVVKSAWLEMDPAPQAAHAFFTRPALIRDVVTDHCHRATVGLVGLHIALKTVSSPQWIWASFEHVDNVPADGGPPPWTFFDPKDGLMPPGPPQDDIVKPHTPGTPVPPFHPVPFNVDRQLPIDNLIIDRNTAWQAFMAADPARAVWSNYRLVTVQWPLLGKSPSLDASAVNPQPIGCQYNTANTTMETFVQLPDKCSGIDHTCMGCHNNARTSDFIFALPLDAQLRLPFFETSGNRFDALRRLQEIVERHETPTVIGPK